MPVSEIPSERHRRSTGSRKGLEGAAPMTLSVFGWGDGAFKSGHLANGLDLVIPMGKNLKHGGVRPQQLVPLAAFRANIEATRDQWDLDENP